MSRPYSPKTFLRQVPNHLLKEFFDRRNQLRDVDWITPKETEVALIFDAWQALPAKERSEAEGVFQTVHEMAGEAGVRAMVEEGQFHGLDLAAELNRLEGHYHKAMYTYLRHERVFSVASYFLSADSLAKRFWFRHKGLSKKNPATGDEDVRRFADELSDFYKDTQGRGHRCVIETYLRSGRQHYYFAYPDDYTDTFIGYDEQGEFTKRPQKQAFENVFVYDPQEGTLDLYAQGDRGVRARLVYIFCGVILGENPPPEQPGDHPFELNGLRSREFAFNADPADGVEDVRVVQLRLSLGSGRRRITLEADPQGGREDLYDMLDEFLDAQALSAAGANVTQARILIRLAANLGGRPKVIRINLGFPNSSDIKGLPEDQRLLAEKCLKRWGIVRG